MSARMLKLVTTLIFSAACRERGSQRANNRNR